VARVPVPARVLDAELLEPVDYADAFVAPVPARDLDDLAAFGQAVFGAFPRWLMILLAVRNLLVKLLGLRSSDEIPWPPVDEELRVGSRLGAFTVHGFDEDEIVLGEDDDHLDFRVSMLREPSGEGIILTTLVKHNDWRGRLYFLPVGFFHRLIVPAMMRSAVTRLDSR
jgi:hypothetical protein